MTVHPLPAVRCQGHPRAGPVRPGCPGSPATAPPTAARPPSTPGRGRHTQRLHRPRPSPAPAGRLRTPLQPHRPAHPMEVHPQPTSPTCQPDSNDPSTTPSTPAAVTSRSATGRLPTPKNLPTEPLSQGDSAARLRARFAGAARVLSQAALPVGGAEVGCGCLAAEFVQQRGQAGVADRVASLAEASR